MSRSPCALGFSIREEGVEPVASGGLLVLMVRITGTPRASSDRDSESEGVQADPGMGHPCAQHEGTLGLAMKGRRGGPDTHFPGDPWQVAEEGVE